MTKIKITQVKSAIGQTKTQKATLLALGLKKMNQSREHTANSQINGMIGKVNHLIKVEEI